MLLHMLPFKLQFKPGVAVYEQVIYAVEKAMVVGQFRPGDRFPSVRQLSQELRIHPNTAQKIVSYLTQAGLLHVQPGVGTIIATRPEGLPEQKQALLGSEAERLVVEARKLGLTLQQVTSAIEKQWKKTEFKQ